MSVRTWYKEVIVDDDIVKVILDVTGYNPIDLWVGIDEKFNSLVVLYNKEENKHIDIPIPVKVKNDFKMDCNNSVLTIIIKRGNENARNTNK